MPELMDIFNDDAFRMVTLTSAINMTPYTPNWLGQQGIFTPDPVRSLDVAVGINDEGALEIVQTTPRGAPPYEQKVPPQSIKSFRTPRIAIGDSIQAHELTSILARGMFNGGDMNIMLQDVQSEIAYRLDGPGKLRAKVEATKEHMRLGAISGIVLDKDGSTVYNWATEFGVALPAEIAFNLSAATPAVGVLVTQVRNLKRSVARAARVGNQPFRLIALSGDTFFDNLVKHPDVLPSWNVFQGNQASRIALGLNSVQPFSVFTWEDIDWVNYRGTDDNSTIAIATDKVKFVPAGIPGLFREALSPYEGFAAQQQPGLPIYVLIVPDRERDQYVRVEVYSYPMYMATRPDVLFSGRAGT